MATVSYGNRDDYVQCVRLYLEKKNLPMDSLVYLFIFLSGSLRGFCFVFVFFFLFFFGNCKCISCHFFTTTLMCEILDQTGDLGLLV